MIPTIKSFSNSAAQAFILLLDFFFRLSPLICIAPPYDVIILYTYTYVNAFSRYFYYLRKAKQQYIVLYPPHYQHIVDNKQFYSKEKHPCECLTWFSLRIWSHSLSARIMGLVLVLRFCLIGHAVKHILRFSLILLLLLIFVHLITSEIVWAGNRKTYIK